MTGSAAGRLERAEGSLSLEATAAGGATRLARLAQRAPCRVFFPRREPGAPLEAVLVNTGGGIVEGDRLQFRMTAGPGADLAVGTQAAEKIYRAIGDTARVATRLEAGAGALLAWLPQETILFDGARLRRRLEAALDPAATLLAAETVMFGRAARGERLTHGLLHDFWAIRIGGRLVWADAVRLDGDIAAARARPFGFGDAAGYATLVLAGPAAASFLPLAREIATGCAVEAGASLVGGVLVMRFLAADEAALRETAAAAAARLGSAVRGGERE